MTGLTIVLGGAQQYRTQRRRRTAEQVAIDIEAELILTLNGALAPITNYLGEMADATTTTERAAVAGRLCQAVVDAAVRLTADGSRSSFYRLDKDWQGLTREVWGGRSMQPRPAFAAGTPDGDAVLGIVRAGDFVLIYDAWRARWSLRASAPATQALSRWRSRPVRGRWGCSRWTLLAQATSARPMSSCYGYWLTFSGRGWPRCELTGVVVGGGG